VTNPKHISLPSGVTADMTTTPVPGYLRESNLAPRSPRNRLVASGCAAGEKWFRNGCVATIKKGEGRGPERNWATRSQAARSNSLSMN
jgi:hypothetical protein